MSMLKPGTHFSLMIGYFFLAKILGFKGPLESNKKKPINGRPILLLLLLFSINFNIENNHNKYSGLHKLVVE
ncbi:hypothetical protein DERF_008443 [Dermatophagoides farinae]|uniref:Uncharacterized protein n=1 Tax=Dermatophagoides farinae TaxID=6954 RepID=A0A922L6Z6_DERFA|nr:hypothetical protein DERF_008443 [Dermatophagoides farinae]